MPTNQTCKQKTHVSSPTQVVRSKPTCYNPRNKQPRGKATGLPSGISGERTVASLVKHTKHTTKSSKSKSPPKSLSGNQDNSARRWQSKFRVIPFQHGKETRFIFQDAETLVPSTSISLYEVFLSRKEKSHNTTKNILRNLSRVYTWAKESHFEIERLLLNGEAPNPEDIRAFTYWLSENAASTAQYNSIIDSTAQLFRWFVKQHGSFEGISNARLVHRQMALTALLELFRDQKKKCRTKKYAEDLTEEEVAKIEQFLKPANRRGVKAAVAVRDYLMWRLAIEFGLRPGEILALRLSDCPHEGQDFIKIVRIDERGPNYFDPRAPNHPSPKTLSRDLGFLIDGSPIPNLISDYHSEQRTMSVKRMGKNIKIPPKHEFLILNHQRKTGMPLSKSGMRKVAEYIAKATGVAFHWHIARHAFFNRAYADVMNQTDIKAKMMELVEWGGWSDEKSLQLYVNRARRERARMALSIWQTGKNKWEALQ